MPFSTPDTVNSMDEAVQQIVGNLPTDSASAGSWQAANAWAPVATAFFSGGVVPSVTEPGKAAGESAFIAAANGALGGELNKMSEAALSAGFHAYAAAIVAPGMCLPPAPAVHAPPPAPPPLTLSGLPPSESTLPATTVLYNQLLTWVVSGTQTTPGPVVVPWS